MCKRAPIDKIKLSAKRHTVRDTAERQPFGNQKLRNVVRSSLAFDGGIGGQYRLFEIALSHSAEQFRDAYGLWPKAIERRQVPFEDEIATSETGLLYCEHIYRALDDTKQGIVPTRVSALGAQLFLA